MKRNIKAKLLDLGVRESSQQIVISDIFGQQIGSHQVEGLVDSENDEEFKKRLHVLARKWKRMDSSESGHMHTFITWFYQHKYSLLKQSMLKSVRRKAGLGDPPAPFTANSSESINSLLKSRMDCKKNELPTFLDKLKSVIDDQQCEVERAIIGRGKYELCKQYKKLEKTEDQWFMKMTIAQRQTHVNEFHHLQLGLR